MSVSFNGYKNQTLTIEKENCRIGSPVTINNYGRISSVEIGGSFIGVCTAMKGEYACVQTDGYIELKYSGNKPSYGYQFFVASNDDTITITTDAYDGKRAAMVVKVDEVNRIVGIIL